MLHLPWWVRSIAKRHAELLGQRQIAGAGLAAVCDIVPDKARALGRAVRRAALRRHARDDAGAQRHRRRRRADRERPARAARDRARAHTGKHIVVEKPMALTLDDADAMIRACDRAGVKLFVVKQNRFNVPVVKLREALERRPLRQAGDGHRARALVPHAGLLRPGRLARHLGARRRRARQPGEPSHRPARMDDGRRRERVRACAPPRWSNIETEDTAVVVLQVPQRRARASSRRRPRRGPRISRARSRSSAKAARSRSAASRSTR